jgi:hypothetical protein
MDSFDIRMSYQLVLQFRGDSLEDLDAAIALEEDLIEQLGESADVDGHDVGSGETNIFILTAEPKATFQRIKPLLKRKQQLKSVTVAYRKIDGEQFTVIWPQRVTGQFKVS